MRIAAEPGSRFVSPSVRRLALRRSRDDADDADRERGTALRSSISGVRENTQELIAHEFEHIIEQLDGVDLAARAALPNTGVTAFGHAADMFETTRAQRTGLKVVSELRR